MRSEVWTRDAIHHWTLKAGNCKRWKQRRWPLSVLFPAPFPSVCLYYFTHCPRFSPSCNKRHLLCLTLTVQVMGSASGASTGSFTSRWTASPAPVQLGGPACLSFLFRSYHSCRHRYSNAFEKREQRDFAEVWVQNIAPWGPAFFPHYWSSHWAMLLLTTGNSRSGISSCFAARLQLTSSARFPEPSPLPGALSPVSSSLSHLPGCL